MAIEKVTAYLGLGSNMGDRQQNIDKGLELLSQRLRLGDISSLYDTEPVGNVEQPRFLNMVCQVFTTLAAEGLLALAKGIESKMGRVPLSATSGGPRPLDIDILLYGDKIINTPTLVIPHPRMMERAFVLVPLAEIAPDLVHPVSGKKIKELLKEITEKQGVFKWETI